MHATCLGLETLAIIMSGDLGILSAYDAGSLPSVMQVRPYWCSVITQFASTSYLYSFWVLLHIVSLRAVGTSNPHLMNSDLGEAQSKQDHLGSIVTRFTTGQFVVGSVVGGSATLSDSSSLQVLLF